MIALDPNVLVRLLVNDDPAQAATARKLFDANGDTEGALFISDVVLAELAWVLRSRYAVARPAMAKALQALLSNATLAWQSRSAVAQALEWFIRDEHVDFADALVVALAQAHACEATATFDRGMSTLPGAPVIA